eukprot:m.153168 g.153168  ORF g.153168 m.153168 type:complete len:658 (+) comp17459_c0_seq2:116-2089(+)
MAGVFRAAVIAATAAVLLLCAQPCKGEIVTAVFFPVMDATLIEKNSVAQQAGNSRGKLLFSGRSATGTLFRALVKFDVSQVPAGASVKSASLSLGFELPQDLSDRPVGKVTVHRVTTSWGEGPSSSERGGGKPAQPADPTWLYAAYSDRTWNTKGGDFEQNPSGTHLPNDYDQASVTGSGLANDVQAWLAQPSDNYGWIIRVDETENMTARKFHSSEADEALVDGPRLTLTLDIPNHRAVAARARFRREDSDGIEGEISFSQAFPGASTRVAVQLAGLDQRVGNYHVHSLPLFAPGGGAELVGTVAGATCSDTLGHWDPAGVADASGCTAPARQHLMAPTACEVGDLSGKHGPLQDKSDVSVVLYDPDLPLTGPTGILFRSVVLHHAATDARVTCATIEPKAPQLVALANFSSTALGGHVLLMQDAAAGSGTGNTETTLIVSMRDPNAPAAADTQVYQHNWHVHELAGDTCSDVGGHFNPRQVCSTCDAYTQTCGSSPSAQPQCEVGDLSHKHGVLTLTDKVVVSIFRDVDLPLVSGDLAVAGRTIGIHQANLGTLLQACATMELQAPASNDGSGTSGGSSVSLIVIVIPVVAAAGIALLALVLYRTRRTGSRAVPVSSYKEMMSKETDPDLKSAGSVFDDMELDDGNPQDHGDSFV